MEINNDTEWLMFRVEVAFPSNRVMYFWATSETEARQLRADLYGSTGRCGMIRRVAVPKTKKRLAVWLNEHMGGKKRLDE